MGIRNKATEQRSILVSARLHEVKSQFVMLTLPGDSRCHHHLYQFLRSYYNKMPEIEDRLSWFLIFSGSRAWCWLLLSPVEGLCGI